MHFPNSCVIITKLSARQWYALLAQLDRASGYGPEGQGFESLGACQKPRNRKVSGFFLFYPNIFLVKSSGFRIFGDGNVVQESSSFLNTCRIFRTFSAQIPFKRKNSVFTIGFSHKNRRFFRRGRSSRVPPSGPH